MGVVVTVVFALTRPLGLRGAMGLWRGKSGKTRRERFYTAHVVLVGLFCFGAYAHVVQARGFVLETVGGFGVNLGWGMLC